MQTSFGFKYLSKIQMNLKNGLFLYNFSSFLLRYILWCLIKPLVIITQHFFFPIFSSRNTSPGKTSELHHRTRPSIQPQIRTPNQNTTSLHRQPDHQIRPLEQTTTTSPDHKIRSIHQTTYHHPPNRTAYPTPWNGTGQVHSLWVGSRGLYRALDEPCKAYFPHTFGLKFPDFFFGLM